MAGAIRAPGLHRNASLIFHHDFTLLARSVDKVIPAQEQSTD